MYTLLLRVLPARADSARDLPALETAMQGLALDRRSPIALELMATATQRQFLLRAEQQGALRHLASQIQARYPQSVIGPQEQDPIYLLPNEDCSVIELRPGAPPYFPLRSLEPRDLLAEGTDPLLGILSAMGDIPAGTRAIAQLALVPAIPTWSKRYQRTALQHALEPERARERQGQRQQHE